MSNIFFNLFKKTEKPQAINRLELVSIHIPKTAGTSFRNTLREVYGENNVIRLDIGLVRQEVRIEEKLYDLPTFPPNTKVIHGHFSYPLLIKNFSIPKETPIITWLRDPVKRVISNYFYLAKRLEEELDEEGKGLNILRKMQRSLIEYARFEGAQNRQSKFLSGLTLENLQFVGIVETYEEDIQQLSQILEWPKTPIFTHNQTNRDTSIISQKDIDEIRELNSADLKLYEQALNLRTKGHWK
jgi:hypothetical protein